MEFKRASFRLTSVVLAAGLLPTLLTVTGCSPDKTTVPPQPTAQREVAQTALPAEEPPIIVARRLMKAGDYEAAIEAASKALVKNPNDADATMLVAEAEAARGNHELALELASSIDLNSRLAGRAVRVHAQQLLKLGRTSEAADVVLRALEVMPEDADLRHQVWALLNRVGRREEASLQAETLCTVGMATEPELLSLIRRTNSPPVKQSEESEANKQFEPGLGMARWYFTKEDYDKALAELDSQYQNGFESPAACALYGRLLSETQAIEEFPNWHAKCDDRTKELGDYWAALGTYFFDQRQYESSARALLEAVHINPTDRLTFQRLSKVFRTLERSEESEQFRNRGIKIYETETKSQDLIEFGDPNVRLDIARTMRLLERPFELLQWTESVAGPSNQPQLAAIAQQRVLLHQSSEAFRAPYESALIGLSLNDFNLDPAMKLLRTAQKSGPAPKQRDVKILAQPRLVNVASEVGLDFQWYTDIEIDLTAIPIHESVGGGIAAIDYDLDGWPDVYLAQGSGDPPTSRCTRSNVMYRNLNGKFVDVTSSTETEDYNYSAGLAAGDVNQDGFADLWLASMGHNRLLINNGDGTFHDATERLGEIEDRFSTSLAIADVNGDGLPDLFETNYIEMDGAFALPEKGPDGKPVLPGPLNHVAGNDRWFQNLGDGRFRVHEITREVVRPGTSLGIIVTDVSGDGKNEVFVGNDMRINHLLVQSGENQFTNAADIRGVANGFDGLPNGCMGIAAADFNRDGAIDFHITNFRNEFANLYLQTSGGLFTDFAIRYELDSISEPMVGFGTKAMDVDRNGWVDLLITNGHIFDLRTYGEDAPFQMPPQMLMSAGNRFELTEVDDPSGYWEGLYLGRAMTNFDFDRDGALDVLIGHLEQPVALLHNQTKTDGGWIQIELIGTRSERDAIGAKVVVTAGGEQFTHWVTGGDGYFASDEPVLDFGLGLAREVDQVEVFWPRGEKQTFDDLKPKTRYLIVEGETQAVPR